MRAWIGMVAVVLMAVPSVASAATSQDSSDDGARFLPTLSAAIGRQDARIAGNGWLGAAFLPSSAAFTWFFAAGGEIDVRGYVSPEGERTAFVFGPQVRAGLSFFPDANKYLSAFNAYALTGYRAPSVLNDGALRVGVGASSPLMGISLLGAKLFLPWMAEATVDLAASGYEVAWRLGVAY